MLPSNFDSSKYILTNCGVEITKRNLIFKNIRPSHLEQSASTRHVRTLYACFPRTLEGFSLQAFLSMTRYLKFCNVGAVTVVIFGHLNRSFCLLTYLLIYLLTYTYSRPTPLLGLCYCRRLRPWATGRTAAYNIGADISCYVVNILYKRLRNT